MLSALPSVQTVLGHQRLRDVAAGLPPVLVLRAAQHATATVREQLRRGDGGSDSDRQRLLERVVDEAVADLTRSARPHLLPVINATGVVIHTNLGRSPLCSEAIQAIAATAAGYSNLELDLESGERGHRYQHVEALLLELTGAEAAHVVNNDAAAVLLTLAALAQGREVIVSRGELVEIGGSFRVPDVMVQSGARLVEVGTTNRTHLHDYQRALGPQTALLMKVHPSNFRVLGFTASVSLAELAPLARQHGIPLVDDLGSGLMAAGPGLLGDEPVVRRRLEAGADLVMFSGDKLLGGPQAGILVGRRDLVAALRKHPLSRALRIDKLCLAALEATLRLHLEPARAAAGVPVLRMLGASDQELAARAQALAGRLGETLTALGLGPLPEVLAGHSEIGGGALPARELPTTLVALHAPAGASVEALAAALRVGRRPVVARIAQDRVLLDPRTVLPGEEEALVEAAVAATQAVAATAIPG